MSATLVFRDRVVFGDRDFAELVIWRVPTPVLGSRHSIKYRLAYIVDGERVIGFDNELGKGDHRHENGIEIPYQFHGVEQLVDDFKAAIGTWRATHGKD